MATAGMMYGSSAFALPETPPAPAPKTQAPLQFGKGEVTFTGTITSSPCDIAPEDSNIQVAFGQVSDRHFKKTDNTTDSKKFTIHLKNCSFDKDTATSGANPVGLMSKVTVTFTGTGETTHHSYPSTGSTQDVGVQILESDNTTVINPGTDAKEKQLSADSNDLDFFARLIALKDNAAPGEVKASVTYNLKYM